MLSRAFVAISFGMAAFAAFAAGKPDLSALEAAVGGERAASVRPAPIPGMYEVLINGRLLYLSEDGRYAVQGDVVDLRTRENLTETRRSEMRAKAISSLSEDKMVVFAPKGPTKHTVTVFTDIDCGYCRKLHREIAAYNDEGIKVRYLAFPRAGIGSESYDKAVSVWCSGDPEDAMTRAKQGEELAKKSCANPVADQFELGQELGVRGTPSMILENGEMLPGYVPAARLAQTLNTNQ